MLYHLRFRRPRRSGAVLVIGLACIALPAVAHAAPVDLGTAKSFVVLAGSTATNTGPSVLNGDLGVSPGTALVGFGLPAVVNGATHATNAVAAQAQLDLTTAYDVAAGQPVLPANDLTGTDLGNRILKAGAYRYTSSALLTGPLTLDAEGDPNAQFVFEIASSLTTASASSVVLLNGASPCNVYWQVGTSATLGTTTAFQGNLMALSSISLNNGATVIGRLLARNGAVS
jgi:Ice-binding-like